MIRNVLQYLDEMKIIENSLLQIFEEEKDEESNCFENFVQNIFSPSIQEDNEKFEIMLRLLVSIANNHHRCSHFYEKIENIIMQFRDSIKKIFSNKEIINIFKSNKRILLFLIMERIIIIDEYFISKIAKTKYKNRKYIEYFTPELISIDNNIEKILQEKIILPKILPDSFEKNRQIGENESYLCELIRNDSIIDFVVYVNKTNLYLDMELNPSIFETNLFLIDKTPTLIEYAAFYGSIQIFQYLLLNNVKLTPSLFLYAIHSNNPELIHHVEKIANIEPQECFSESIKCHHNEIAHYIKENFLQDNNECLNIDFGELEIQMPMAVCYYNFQFFPNDLNIIQFPFYFLYKYKYIRILKYYLKEFNIDLDNFLINIDDYELLEYLDFSWTSGKYFCIVKNKFTSEMYIMQVLDKGYEYGAENFEKSLTLNYPCILKVKGYSPIDFDHEKNSSILFEYMPRGKLIKYIESKNPEISGTKSYIIILGIAICFRFIINKQNIISYSIGKNSFLLDEKYYPVIYEFYYSRDSMFLPGDQSKYDSTFRIENQAFVPPEGIDVVPATFVYKYSIFVYYIITKHIKFDFKISSHNYFKFIENGNRPDISMIDNKYIIQLLNKCWATNPDDRISFDEIIDYITNKEFYSYFQLFDRNSVIEYLNIYGTEFDYLKNKF